MNGLKLLGKHVYRADELEVKTAAQSEVARRAPLGADGHGFLVRAAAALRAGRERGKVGASVAERQADCANNVVGLNAARKHCLEVRIEVVMARMKRVQERVAGVVLIVFADGENHDAPRIEHAGRTPGNIFHGERKVRGREAAGRT